MKIGFMGLMILVVIVGVAVGGAYAAGMAIGKNSVPPASQVFGAVGAASSGGEGAAGRGAAAAAGAGLAGMGGAAAMGAGGSAVMGTVEKLDGNVLTVSTQGGGSAQVTINENTTLRKLADAPKDELKQGVRVVVTGQQGTGGGLTASSIQIVAADAATSPAQTPGIPGRVRKPDGTQAAP